MRDEKLVTRDKRLHAVSKIKSFEDLAVWQTDKELACRLAQIDELSKGINSLIRGTRNLKNREE